MVYRSLGPDLAAMAVDDALNGGQSYSGAFKLFRQMQTLKDAEQLVYVLHVKASAVFGCRSRSGWWTRFVRDQPSPSPSLTLE